MKTFQYETDSKNPFSFIKFAWYYLFQSHPFIIIYLFRLIVVILSINLITIEHPMKLNLLIYSFEIILIL